MNGPRSAWWRGAGAVALCLASGPQALAEIARPAELPPSDYRGQQYVDSRGCLFMRAGQPGNEIWIPRVTRQGVPLCGNPPSGDRVPVAEEGGATVVTPAAPADAAPAAAEAPGGAYLVAVGSFGVAANADKAETRLRALNYPVRRGQMGGGSGGLVTVFAGPFASADEAARVRAALQGQGFPDAMVIGP